MSRTENVLKAEISHTLAQELSFGGDLGITSVTNRIAGRNFDAGMTVKNKENRFSGVYPDRVIEINFPGLVEGEIRSYREVKQDTRKWVGFEVIEKDEGDERGISKPPKSIIQYSEFGRGTESRVVNLYESNTPLDQIFAEIGDGQIEPTGLPEGLEVNQIKEYHKTYLVVRNLYLKLAQQIGSTIKEEQVNETVRKHVAEFIKKSDYSLQYLLKTFSGESIEKTNLLAYPAKWLEWEADE